MSAADAFIIALAGTVVIVQYRLKKAVVPLPS
jgi:hypothetical protein